MNDLNLSTFIGQTGYKLDIGSANDGNSWKPIGDGPVANFGNGNDNTHPTLALFFFDGTVKTATVFNGTNNPDGTGNFDWTPGHKGEAMGVPMPDGVTIEQLIDPVSCFVLDVGSADQPNSWKPAGSAPVPAMGNGSDGTNPELILIYPDGKVGGLKVFNGTNNPESTGNFETPPNHDPAENVIAAIAKEQD